MNAYILTRTHNEHDQYGSYFVAFFNRLPTVGDLKAAIDKDDGDSQNEYSEDRLSRIIAGGGREPGEDWFWYTLSKHPSSN